MYSLYFIPYLKLILLGFMILFYSFLFQSKKHRWLVIFHILLCVLVYGQSTYFEILNVTNFKGYYTSAIIDALFVIIFLFLSVIIFREKIKIYKKIIVGFSVVLILLISCYEYFILTIRGFKDHTEKIYTINDRFVLRKEFIDFGRPYPYVIEEDKYLIFIRSRSPMYQIGAEDLDSIQTISFRGGVLKLRVYQNSTFSDATILLKYDLNEKPYNGLVKVTKSGKSGFINLQQKIVIPLEYDYLAGFDGKGICIAHKKGKVGAINTQNQIVKPFK